MASSAQTDLIMDVIVDTPRGSRCKYRFDSHGKLCLGKLLPKGAVFPCNFGSVPQTLADDGDPLDVLILGEEPIVVGCQVPARIIGVLEAEQSAAGTPFIRNDRLIGVVQTEFNPGEPASIDKLSEQDRLELEHFFRSYNELEGRDFKPLGWHGIQRASELLAQARDRARQQ